MVFSSYDFLFIFLPCALVFYYTAAFFFKRDEIKFLVLLLFSVLFYGMWKFQDLYIISISIILNYLIGRSLLKKRSSIVLSIGVLLNLLGLGYFKYRYFLAGIFVDGFSSEKLVLPLAISFFTFQQIAWIVDIYRGDKRVPDIIKYSTFVTFFPQLIAGPIVRFSDIAEQYEKLLTKKRAVINIVIGFSYFCIGLAKKVIIADRFAVLADVVFSRAQSGEDIEMLASWLGVLAYTFQIYFDFSGYSDMAIGLGRMFGIKLPVNFFSPYKSKNIVEFWRRWHITLSLFLRDCLYIPLGGSRKSIWGGASRYANLMITMLLGGLWHGASWTFVAWGGWHGLLLIICHSWKKQTYIKKRRTNSHFLNIACIGLTFLCVVFSWVMFRSESFESAIFMYKNMFNITNASLNTWFANPLYYGVPETLAKNLIEHTGLSSLESAYLFWTLAVMCGGFVSFFLPSSTEIFNSSKNSLKMQASRLIDVWHHKLYWKPSVSWRCYVACLFMICIVLMKREVGFLYFDF